MAALDVELRDGVDRETIDTVNAMSGAYKYGWATDIETDYAPKGLSEDIVRLISDREGRRLDRGPLHARDGLCSIGGT